MASSVVFIDSRVTGYESIVAGLGAGTEWALLTPDQDGIEQIRARLTGYSGLSSIHIVSHGSAGNLYLGSGVLTPESMQANADALQAIGAALSADGDLLLYGCDVAQGEAGQVFLEQLARLTQADVAASVDATGAAALGGNWVLERSTGGIEASPIVVDAYSGLLDTVNGTTGDDTLAGTAGNDTINGLAGNDTLTGGAGDDQLNGGAGNDSLLGDAGNDTLEGNAGTDTLAGGAGNDRLDGGTGNDFVDGGDDNDEIIGNGGDDYLLGGDGNDTMLGGGGYIPDGSIGAEGDSDTIDGGAGDDAIYGEWGDDILHGGLGDDTLDGQEQDDVLFGDAGDDNLVGADGDDSLLGGDGIDSLVGGTGQDTLWGEAGTDILYGGADNDVLHGGLDNDTLHGDDGDDVLFGEAGDDSVVGEAGQDVLYGAEGNDTLVGGDDSDSLVGGAGNDVLYGDAGNDRLSDTQGSNDLHGGEGDDRLSASGNVSTDTARLWGDADNDVLQASSLKQAMLDGGAGGDTLVVDGVSQAVLTGGGGADRFVLTAAQVGKITTITDFTAGAGGDLLDYSDVLLQGATGYVAGTNPFETGFLRWRQVGADAVLDFDANGTVGPSSYAPLVTLKNVVAANLVAGSNFTTAATNTAPVATGGSLSTDEDTPLSGSVAATDAEGNILSYSVVTQPAHGTLSFNADGSYLYIPNTNSTVLDSFTFKANDGVLDSNVAMVSITVTARNDSPVAADSSFATNEDIAYVGQVSATDVEGDALTYSVDWNPWYGTVAMKADGSYVYTPSANFHGSDSFIFKANDGELDSYGVVNITVNSVNDVPVAQSSSVVIREDTYYWWSDTLPATDEDHDALSYVIVDQPDHGTLAVDPAGYYRYIPVANYSGIDSFSFKVNDGKADSNTAIVNIAVTPENDRPAAADSSFATNEDTAYTGQVSATDAEGDPLTYSVVDWKPSHGTVDMKADGSYVYTPNANYHGSDSFSFRANDGELDSYAATVNITVNSVNDVPVAQSSSVVIREDTYYWWSDTLPATDEDRDALSYVIVDQPAHGTLAVDAAGYYRYIPGANYSGIDSFSFKVNDGKADSNTAIVNITVTPENDRPAAADSSFSTNEDTAYAGQVGATDVDGDALTYSVASNPWYGTVTMGADGGYIYTPNANYYGADRFYFKANDGTTDSEWVRVSITVKSANDLPVANDASIVTDEDTTVTGSVSGADPVEQSPLTYSVVTQPAHGQLTFKSDGSYSYTPTANFNGTDSFTVKANDGSDDSKPATVSITVKSVNDSPVALDAILSTQEDTVVAGQVSASDPVENSPLTYAVVNEPLHGAVLLFSDGSYLYSPVLNYNGIDLFTFKANDGTDDSNVATVSVVVTSVNDAPTSSNVSAGTSEDVPFTGKLAFASDSERHPISYAKVTDPAHGSVVVNADGSYTYTPNANYNGSDSFTYSVSDGQVSSSYLVSLSVNPVNDVPVVSDAVQTTTEDNAVSGTLAGTDADNDALSFRVVGKPAHGSVTVGADGGYTYTPVANYNGSDSFTFKASDGTDDSRLGTVAFTVTAINDAPVSSNTSIYTSEDKPVGGFLPVASDSDGGVPVYAKAVDPAHGSATVDASGAYSYTPAANFNGSDSFSYSVSDGQGGTSTYGVSVTVNAVNDVPVVADFVADQSFGVAQGFNLVLPAGLFSDVDGDSLQWSATLASGAPLPAWLPFAPSAHSFSVVAGSAVQGVYDLKISASDGELTASTEFTLTVNGALGEILGTDGNRDGVLDSLQDGVYSALFSSTLPGESKPSIVTLVADSMVGQVPAQSKAKITGMSQEIIPPDAPADMDTPLGLVSFTALTPVAGGIETFSLFVDASLGVNGYWKQSSLGTWTNLASVSNGGDMIAEGGLLRLDFQIQDGGQFDADSKADGVITDPGAAAFMPLTIVAYTPDLPSTGFWF